MRLTLIGGFLGAGKTTWLRHQIYSGAFPAAVVLVNEAAGTPLDDALLGHGTVLLGGGCACCAGKAQMLAALRKLADRASRGDGPENVVLETSGLADPAAIVAAVQSDPVLVHHISFEPIIVAIDAANGRAQLETEPLARQQVAAAGHLIVTNTDTSSSAAVSDLLALLRTLNPAARTSGAAMGEDTPLPSISPEAQRLADEAGDTAPPALETLHLPDGTDWTAFAVWLSALIHARGDRIIRIKGVVRTPAGRLLIQAVRTTMQAPEVLPETAGAQDNAVVFFSRGHAPGALDASFRRIVLGEEQAA